MNRSACYAIAFFMFLMQASAIGADYSIPHSFTGGTTDGANPYGSLTSDDSSLYGMTTNGGSHKVGCVFAINSDGSGYQVLHSFSGNSDEPAHAFGSLALSGSTLYGMMHDGNIYSNSGGIFSMKTDGSGFNVLHLFYGGDNDGMFPMGSVTLDGSTMYGMTENGGSANKGTIFAMNTDGSGFRLLHSFQGGINDGSLPEGDLLRIGSTLYGMTVHGGGNTLDGYGTIFSIDTDGSGFHVLHSFQYTPYEGTNPFGNLICDNSTLFGMAQGTVFRLGVDGNGFSVLHIFNGQTNDGNDPLDSLILNGSTLYGTTVKGGSSPYGNGTVFSIGTDGSNFTLLHQFTGGSGDGANPNGDVTLVGSTLYGLTAHGGANDNGVIFALTIPEPSSVVLLVIGIASVVAYSWRKQKGTP